jgi:16S rRNA (guanine966-N2)-methyltransferase
MENAPMRIVAGRHRGRRLVAPEGLAVRPTGDRAREALFDILASGRLTGGESALAGAVVLDAFAGSGALGLEALSRGAAHVVFMENHAPALAALERNIEALDEGERSEVLRADVLRPPRPSGPARNSGCTLALLDPPYNQGLAAPALSALTAGGWLVPGALASVELMAGEPFEPPDGFTRLDSRKYGKARIEILRWEG